MGSAILKNIFKLSYTYRKCTNERGILIRVHKVKTPLYPPPRSSIRWKGHNVGKDS